MKKCRHCKTILSFDDVSFCSYDCEHKYYEKRDKAKRAKLRAVGKWPRLCAECGEGLIKGHAHYAFSNMDGSVDQNSLRCDDCEQAEQEWYDNEMQNL